MKDSLTLQNFKTIVEFMAKEIANKLYKVAQAIPDLYQEESYVAQLWVKNKPVYILWDKLEFGFEDDNIRVDFWSITAEDVYAMFSPRMIEEIWKIDKATIHVYDRNKYICNLSEEPTVIIKL